MHCEVAIRKMNKWIEENIAMLIIYNKYARWSTRK